MVNNSGDRNQGTRVNGADATRTKAARIDRLRRRLADAKAHDPEDMLYPIIGALLDLLADEL